MNGLKSNQIGSSSLKIRQHWPYDLISILSVKISQLMQAYLENNTNNKRRNNDTVGARSLTIIGNRGRRASGVKRTDFIIPREVPVNEVSLKMDVATLPAAAAATSCAADLHPHTTKGPSKKNY
ncbi:PREDICTED: uncharacterized protein LOC105114614 isoform X2 [Populus euphratica]|uniref:Uncharacterized protein LOC105114614 isoform X2 n=1 Tax=Populus euphratica TaxID=75702 RepID=A0AAJ6X8P6_POPEU|nr:PREDICTED: uncharacterized protein LOC105114614 isoform X2 [Populus euphratica]